MTEEDREQERRLAEHLAALEEERGPFVYNGAVGGPPRPVDGAGAVSQSAALRARRRVRFVARAVPKKEQAA